jgi:DNA-directed RNA polymerase subunit M/transcription elongation factor TFIIS
MVMIEFKVCPRCRGDLYRAEDMYGKYVSCFQCGYMRDLPNETLVVTQGPTPQDKDKRAAA